MSKDVYKRQALCRLAAPAFEWLGLPGEVAPLVLLRPMSGSASLALVEKLLAQYGADLSLIHI